MLKTKHFLGLTAVALIAGVIGCGGNDGPQRAVVVTSATTDTTASTGVLSQMAPAPAAAATSTTR